MSQLLELACGLPTDKGTVHSYLPVYDQLFSRYQAKRIDLLEIGVRRGGSLMLWQKYFLKAKITGIDVKDNTRGKLHKNINLIIGNAYDQETADKLPMQDIIIDDGPHTLQSQIDAIRLYLPKLKKDGMMIIEDVPGAIVAELLIDEVPLEYSVEMIDLRSTKGRFDDMLLVIEHEN